MGDRPLFVAFLWHMHQPYYRDPVAGIYRLPWVRLHGVKDYLDMVKILEDFPRIRQTINCVPSLFEQLRDYVENNATDRYLEVTRKSASDLSETEKTFVIENFFLANWDTMIKPFPRYYELLMKRGLRYTRGDLSRLARYFSDSDIRDLQVLFNLAWTDPMFRTTDPFLKELSGKDRGFTEEEKVLLIDRQFEILRQILPEYKRMQETGQIEISVSPFYHPILPLLWDTDTARVAMPQVQLPKKRFTHPEDAIAQIKMGVEYYAKTFGRPPSGMWPSEGSVSEEVVQAISAEGIKWIATDEEVLARSLNRPLRSPEGHLTEPSTLYRPHQFSGVSIFFRDHRLSDLIGFVYSQVRAEKAVEDFIAKLAQIRESLPRDRPFVVPVILDGENAWEYYPNDGQDFLRGLYRALERDGRFRTVTLSEFLHEHGQGEPLKRLHAGSWIYANFGIWIGHEEDNLAWDYLLQTRDDLEAFAQAHPEQDLSEAWKALYAAEGSDWNWWYGDDHVTETQEDFDELFRGYLIKVYREIGKDVPQSLYIPILLKDRSIAPSTPPRGFITPRIDGRVTSFFEWHQGAFIDVTHTGGSMHRVEGLISKVYYGFNTQNLYLRADPLRPFSEMEEHIVLHVHIMHPHTFVITFLIRQSPPKAVLYEKVDEEWRVVKEIINVAAQDIFEIEIPFIDIMAKENDDIHLSIELSRNGTEALSPDQKIAALHSLERCPARGYISITVPPPHYEKIMWY